MSANVHAALYRRLVALYPREFRDEYREDLAATFATQLIDDGALRCAAGCERPGTSSSRFPPSTWSHACTVRPHLGSP